MIKSDGLKTNETFTEKHGIIKEAIRGDILKVMKTTQIHNHDASPKTKQKTGSKEKSSSLKKISAPLPALTQFKLEITILPDSSNKIFSKNVGKALENILPQYIKKLMESIKSALQEAVVETKQFAKNHGKHALSSFIPFYGFSEGPDMITGMEEICMSHFDRMVSSKICEIAANFKPDLKATKGIALALTKSKEWKQKKCLFHHQFKKENDTKGTLCVIS